MKKFKTIFLLLIVFTCFFCLAGCMSDPEPDPDPDPIPTGETSYYTGSLLEIDVEKKYIEVYNCPVTSLDPEVAVFIITGNSGVTKTPGSLADLYIGMDNIYLKAVNEQIEEIIIDGFRGYRSIRVAIRSSITNIADTSAIFHDTITLTTSSSSILRTFDGLWSMSIDQGKTFNISSDGNEISIKTGSTTHITTSKRIILESSETSVTSISRSLGTPSYSGSLDFSLVNGRILLINQVGIEDYLVKVVPSEMPGDFGTAALGAQAIAARTYAINDIINSPNKTLGYSVDDSEMSQVYNNQRTNASTTSAVTSTAGKVMYHNNVPITAFFYSTTSGLTASANEVWIVDKVIEPINYLLGKNLTDQVVDTSSEASMLAFFKKINISSPGGSSDNHRWKISMTTEQLATTIQYNLPLMYKSYPNSILTKVGGDFVSKAIPSNIGSITNIYVGERGTSGVVVSLIIETTIATFKIVNQYNIRFTIRPVNAGSTVVKEYANSSVSTYNKSATNPSILPSGFFALEWSGNTLNFYGGGNGHGVGMCQYSAKYLGGAGYSTEEILKTFYSNIEIRDVSSVFTPAPKYYEYF